MAAACGSTVDQATLRSVEAGGGLVDTDGDGVVDAVVEGSGSTSVATGRTAGRGTTGTRGSTASGTTGGSRTTGTTGGRSGSGSGSGSGNGGNGGGGGGGGTPPVSGFGFDAQTVNVGFVYATDTDAAAGAFGVNGGEDAPHARIARALVEDINRRGGIVGRTVRLVEAPFSSLANSFSAEFEKVCQTLTADNQVVSATTLFQPEPVSILTECLKRKDAVLVLEVQSLYDQQEAARWWPHLYSPATIGFDRYRVLVDKAQAAGFFGANAKVGVVYSDTEPVRRNVDGVLKAALERHGHAMVASPMSPWNSNAQSGLSRNGNEAADAVARFQDEDVEHVMFIGLGSRGPFVFHKAAAGQTFRPKYLYSSMENPSWQASQLTQPGNPDRTLVDTQLNGAMGVGWIPAWDVGESDGASTPGGKECFDTLRRANLDYGTEYATVQVICDYFRFVETVAAEAGGFGAAFWGAAYAKAGPKLRPALTYSVTPGAGRFDGAAVGRTFAYATDCHCFRYTGSPEPLP